MERRRCNIVPLYLPFYVAFVLISFLRYYLQLFFIPSQYSSKISYLKISISSSLFCCFFFILSCPRFSSLYFLLFLSSPHPGQYKRGKLRWKWVDAHFRHVKVSRLVIDPETERDVRLFPYFESWPGRSHETHWSPSRDSHFQGCITCLCVGVSRSETRRHTIIRVRCSKECAECRNTKHVDLNCISQQKTKT